MSALVAVMVVVAVVPLAPRGRAARAQQPATTASTEAIWVTATVIDKDSRLVTDLTKADFEIRDNKVPRAITAFRNDVIPFAMAIMIDISSSMGSNLTTARRGITELLSQFQPGDRAIVGGFDALPWIAPRFSGNAQTLSQAFSTVTGGTAMLCDGPWIDRSKMIRLWDGGKHASADPVPAFGWRLTHHQGTAAWDGLECGINAVASDAETPRRVVLLVTDGMDNVSGSTQADVIRDANAFGVMVYAVGMFGSEGVADDDLKAISEHTGGGYYYLTNRDDLVTAFDHIADELRHQYVFAFSAGDALHGLHDFTVRASRPDTTTRWRRVFPGAMSTGARPAVKATTTPTTTLSVPLPSTLVPPPASRSASPVAPVVSSTPRAPIWDSFDQFLSGDWEAGKAPRLSNEQLGSMFSDLRREGPAWVRVVAAADQARRRVALAGFVLDLLYSQTDPYVWRDSQPASDLLEWTGNALRSGPPEPAERLWYAASIALLERAGAANALDRLVAHAVSRFPDEERFVLARAIAQELRTWPEPRDLHPFAIDAATAVALKARYDEAIARPSVHQEALVRLGYFELRRGHIDAALALFNQVGTPEDIYVRYWAHLFQGRALERANRFDEAIASYQLAFDDVPFAPSVTAALSAALATVHRDAEAAQLAARVMTLPAPEDPWTVYTVPDSRFWQALTDALRKVITP